MNDKLYIHVTPKEPDQDNSAVLYKIIKIDSGNYTGADLATELLSKIGLGINLPTRPNILQVSFSARKKTIAISTLYRNTI